MAKNLSTVWSPHMVTNITCISDTHGLHRRLNLPGGDILIHAGDFAYHKGDVRELTDFAYWLDDQAALYEHVIVIAGNHDFLFQNHPVEAQKLLNRGGRVTYLQDSSVEACGLKIYGSPWQPWFHNWAFNLPRGGQELREKWAAIPPDTNVLVTHGPPLGIGDLTDSGQHAGCEPLLERIHQLKRLKLHVFGHIHEGYGVTHLDDIRCVNASVCDYDYEPTNPPIVVQISR